jgi:hypothetical protein
MSTQAPVSPSEVGSTMLGMLSGMVVALANTVIRTAVKSTDLIDKLLNTSINLVSSAETISAAVEKRAVIYGEGMIRNGALAEREIELKHRLRVKNLEKQEGLVANSPKPAEDQVEEAIEEVMKGKVAEAAAKKKAKK